ncbi:class I SAM-dependent methyltransferase [Fluviispira vulneris]|uniref:class I SAM-dependent methyltransferase n=1 Tax=Fluviispira vulneris TaxID=2763012 RepID=UPI001645646C|nr:class I SAM-dependent methyltransferase [Fluviispira vulneris]
MNNSISSHYDASSENYYLQYERNLLNDVNRVYPANYFRLQLLVNSFIEKNIKRVIEVGVGEGTPLSTLSNLGIDVTGFDISHEMVKKSKEKLQKLGLDPNNIIWGDIQDPITYSSLLRKGQFDALLAMGVMPHVRNDEECLLNIKALVKPGGTVFIEFRNKLFSLFTFNKYTYEFILDDLLSNVSTDIKNLVSAELKNKLEMNKPTPRVIHEENNKSPGYDAILSKFHNPFEISNLFKKCGFKNLNLLWYHYHPAMPYLMEQNRELFRAEALKLEHDTSGWKGMFLCSAFVVEATKE